MSGLQKRASQKYNMCDNFVFLLTKNRRNNVQIYSQGDTSSTSR